MPKVAKLVNNFLVGCDPEFVALDGQGRYVSLAHLDTDEIGYDHGGRVGEFRPAPSKGTYALVKKLQRLINSDTIQRLACEKLRAGAKVGQDSIGGHVHFGFPVPRYEVNQETGHAVQAVQIRALDRITKVLENLDILPKEESSSRRRGAYGGWSDVRDSNGHTEYRTMASWLYDPRVAYLCLTAAKLAASDPQGTLDNLRPTTSSFLHLKNWFERYKTKDINALRAVDRALDKSLLDIQVHPDVNFRERWGSLGL